MDSISQKEIEYLRKNKNTGIEFEYALFYLLNSDKGKSIFLKEVIAFHDFKDRILKIISGTDISTLNSNLKALSWMTFEVKLATQVDDIGPADIILQDPKFQNLGLSVKYQNNCTINVSSKYFLSTDTADKLKTELHNTCEKYIDEMKGRFGSVKNWFRKRKTSKETNKYIDKIRDGVISDWNKKTVNERKDILSKLIHTDSPINFWVVKFGKTKNGYKLEINTAPIKRLNPSAVFLTKEATSYIGFQSNDIVFAKMQVKFNNGILENVKGDNNDFNVDGVLMKIGDPFGSWNFNI